jgi:hypothetical protein
MLGPCRWDRKLREETTTVSCVKSQEGIDLFDMTLLYIGPNEIIVQNTMILNNKTRNAHKYSNTNAYWQHCVIALYNYLVLVFPYFVIQLWLFICLEENMILNIKRKQSSA